MNHIHFDHKIDRILLTIIVVAVGLYIISFQNWLGIGEEQKKFFFFLGGILNVIVLSKIFWYKYYVRWNSKTIMLRLNSLFGHTLRFSNIEDFEFSESKLVINLLKSKKKIIIPISKIAKEDLQRLESILQNHTGIRKTKPAKEIL